MPAVYWTSAKPLFASGPTVGSFGSTAPPAATAAFCEMIWRLLPTAVRRSRLPTSLQNWKVRRCDASAGGYTRKTLPVNPGIAASKHKDVIVCASSAVGFCPS